MSLPVEIPQSDLTTSKSIVLQHNKDGSRVIILEMPTTAQKLTHLKIYTHTLGPFNILTAQSAQNRLQLRFAAPGKPLSEEEVAQIHQDIRNRPL